MSAALRRSSALAVAMVALLGGAPSARAGRIGVERGFYLRVASGPGYGHFVWSSPSGAEGGGFVVGNSVSIGGAVSQRIVLGATASFDPGFLYSGPGRTYFGWSPHGTLGFLVAVMLTPSMPLEFAVGFAGGGNPSGDGVVGGFGSACWSWHPFNVWRWYDVGFYVRVNYAAMTRPSAGGFVHDIRATGGATVLYF